MTKVEINELLRKYVRDYLSPNDNDRALVKKIYESFTKLLNNNCVQIGSYPRFTSIRPLHDLDILYVLGEWNQYEHNPQSALSELFRAVKADYENPTDYAVKVSLQTHSVTIAYFDGKEEIFSVDIVPAYIFSKNEFQLDTYKVPEILRKKHGQKRIDYYQQLSTQGRQMDWINSDPRGYIQVATEVNKSHNDFRKSVKFVKAWANSYKEEYEDFKMKSFHIEQLITLQYKLNSGLEIFDAIFNFFLQLPDSFSKPQITDRADNTRYIDDYINDLTQKQKNLILEARNQFLSQLESVYFDVEIEDLLQPILYMRLPSEDFLFDRQVPTLTESTMTIEGWIQKDGNDSRRLSQQGFIDNGQKIRFRLHMGIDCDEYLWKVKNDNSCEQPRGDITYGSTKNVPEDTKYPGNHYVECYAIRDGVCVAKARQNVVIRNQSKKYY
jgi:hypothetical protein